LGDWEIVRLLDWDNYQSPTLNSSFFLLPSSFFPVARCLLPIPSSFFPVAYCLLPVASSFFLLPSSFFLLPPFKNAK
jgi:hypothetical protein